LVLILAGGKLDVFAPTPFLALQSLSAKEVRLGVKFISLVAIPRWRTDAAFISTVELLALRRSHAEIAPLAAAAIRIVSTIDLRQAFF